MQLTTSCVPTGLMGPRTFIPLLAFGVAACGSDSPTGNDGGNGDVDPVSVQAVAAGLFGLGAATDGFVGPDDEPIEIGASGSLLPSANQVAARLYSAQPSAAPGSAEACPGGGTTETTETSQNVGSPYASGPLQLERVVADDCRDELGASHIDGIFEYGWAEPEGNELYAVSYFRSSGLDGDPDSESYAVSEIQSPDAGLMLRYEIRALGHSCLGCSSPEHGGTFEQQWFMESFWESHESDLAWRVGESTSQPYRTVIVEDPGNDRMEVTVSGRLAVSQTGNPCNFDAHHETVSPIIMRGIDSAEPEPLAGVLDIADRDGAWAHRVEFDDGDVFIDGELVRPEDFDECTFEFSAT